MSLKTRRELTHVTRSQYQQAISTAKSPILDAFVAATGYHRKYALTLLNLPIPPSTSITKTGKIGSPSTPKTLRHRTRTYDKPVEKALLTVWKASNHLCSKRLVPFLPELLPALEQFQEITLEATVREKLLTLSAATCDRLLAPHRRSHGKSTTKPGTLLKHQIPIRTYAEWQDSERRPGFCEIDLVAHCGGVAAGEFAYTLTVTDVFTGWTECAALVNRSQNCVLAALETIRLRLPFALCGVDSDNGAEFINDQLLRYCQANQITFTRCRPYKKNDQCFVEQKNWSVVRRSVGYLRHEGESGVRHLNAVYAALCPYQNYFQPSVKLIRKERDGAKVRKVYDAAKTPYRRLILGETCPETTKENLQIVYASMNPVALLDRIEKAQERLWRSASSSNVSLSNDEAAKTGMKTAG